MASAVEILLKAKDFASDKIDKLKKRVKSLGATSAASSAGTARLSGSVNKLTSRIGAFIGATAGFLAVKGLFEGVINTGAKFETLNTQLAAVTGSAAAGEEAFAWIKEFTKETPFQLDQVSESFIKLKAFGLDPMDGTMQKLVDTASKLGGGQEKLNGIILAVGQAWAKQRLQAEETLQLVERGVPVYDLLSKALGKTTGEIQDMSQKGELGRDAIKALIDAMGDDSIGAAAAEMKNFRGIVSNLKDTFVEFLAEVSDQGVLDFLKGQLSSLSDTMKRMRENGSLTELAKDISNFMIRAAEATKAVVGTIVKFSSELKVLATVFVSVKIGQFAAGMLLLSGRMVAAASATRLLSAALIATPFGIIAIAIGAVANHLIEMNDQTRLAARLSKQTAENKEKEAKLWSDLSERVGVQIKNEQDLNKALADGLIVRNKQTNQLERVVTSTAKSNQALLDAADASTAESIALEAVAQSANKFLEKIEKMEASAGGLSSQLKSLTGEDLAALKIGLEDAISIKYITDVEAAKIETTLLGENMRLLGLDATLLKTGITEAGTAAIEQFIGMARSSKLTAVEFNAGLIASIEKIKTQKGLEKLKDDLEEIGTSTGRTEQQLTRAFSKIEKAIENLNPVIKKVGASLQDMLSSVSASETTSQIDDMANALGTAFDNGEISADEYTKALDRVLAKQREINGNLSDQTDQQDDLNDAGSDTGTTDQLEKENEMRSFTLDLTERQGKALFKAQQQIRKRILATAAQKVSLEEYNSAVADVQENFVKASESAEEFADKILVVANSSGATEQQMQSYVRSLQTAIGSGEDLDDQSLSKLQAALSAAKSKMEALKNETKSTASEVAGLEAELAGLSGNDLKVQQLQSAQRRLEIEDKIKQAQQDGNRDAVANLKKSLALVGQIDKKKQQQIRQDQVQKQTSVSVPGKAQKTVKLQFQAPNGNQASATVDERGANDLIEVLKQSGASTR